MKHKDYEYFEFSKEFNGDKTARKVQEARRKKIEHFCRNKQDDNQSLLSDPLRFKKYDGYICSPDPDNWLTQFSNLISKNLSRLELSFKQKTEVKRNEISSFILTEDPIRRFLKYFHFNARVQRAMPSKFLIAAIRWKYSTLKLQETMKIAVALSPDEFANFFLLAVKNLDGVNNFFISRPWTPGLAEIPLSLLKESEKCQICATKPKFHAKAETASDDMKYLFSQYDFPLPKVENISDEDFHLDELSSSTLEKLVEYYADDFTAFGYDSSQYLK
ncbi:unnamed protein product [Oikopleura dioica]|uniref:Carbohydrate sulfotransferase n=1 Tax=Oikopleura dioica TaxID=34765 RepID=E4Y763_OIKDI|nr:unnamed protein product [Oikopleura dioica]